MFEYLTMGNGANDGAFMSAAGDNVPSSQTIARRRAMALALAAALAFGLAPLAARADGASREREVKAAFLPKFVQFVEWPASAFRKPNDPIVIAVIDDPSGRDPLDGALEQFANGKSVNGRALKVRHVAHDAKDLGECHVVFIPASEDAHLEAVLKAIGKHPLLTVGESDAFPWAGGMIRFYLDDNKVRFEVNPEAVKDADLQISAKLLALARIFKK
jgi:hypothetical protein